MIWCLVRPRKLRSGQRASGQTHTSSKLDIATMTAYSGLRGGAWQGGLRMV